MPLVPPPTRAPSPGATRPSGRSSYDAPPARALYTATVVVELDNVRESEAGRCIEGLRRVGAQARAMYATADADGEPAVRLREPARVLVLYDGEALDGADVARVAGALEAPDPGEAVRGPVVELVATPGLRYYELKNEGARLATTDLVVFLDSDAVPENGWLAALLAPFADPTVDAVGGATYLEPSGLYGRAFALGWFFPLRSDETAVRDHGHYFANNVAFRRARFLAHPFPEISGTAKGACLVQTRGLLAGGGRLCHAPGARAHHPPPNGLSHFVRRAIAGGRDAVLIGEALDPRSRPSYRGALAHGRARLTELPQRVVARRHAVGLGRAGAVGALGIMGAYYTLEAAGAAATRLAPGFMRRHFHV